MAFTHIIFDLDETLYPRSGGLMQAIGQRISLWLEQSLGLSPTEALALRRQYVEEYGTTLGGLIVEHHIDPEAYLAFVHDVPVEALLRPNPALGAMLGAIPLQKAIFTNSTAEHSRRVLRALDVEAHFTALVDIRRLDYCNKPRPEAYGRLLALLDARGPACILVDDRAANLLPAHRLGMTTVQVDGAGGDGVDFVVQDVVEVGPVVERLLHGAVPELAARGG